MAILTHATWNTFYSAVDGRVEEHWFQMDLLRLMGQLGAIPEPEQSEEANPT